MVTSRFRVHINLEAFMGSVQFTSTQCSRMDLFFEKSSVVTEKMFNLEVKLEDPENFVYHVPGIDAHGRLSLKSW